MSDEGGIVEYKGHTAKELYDLAYHWESEAERLLAEIKRLRDYLEAVEVMTRPGEGQCDSVDIVHSVVKSWLPQSGRS